MRNLRKYIGIGLLSLATGFGGFYLGKSSEKIDRITTYSEGDFVSDVKVAKVHKLYGSDKIFVTNTGSDWKSQERTYEPLEKHLNKGPYYEGTSERESRVQTIRSLAQLE